MKKIISLSLSLILTAFVFSLSLIPGETSGGQSLLIAETVKRIIDSIFPDWELPLLLVHQFVRKGAHVAEYFLLGASWLITFRLFSIKIILFPLLGTVIALADEAFQLLAIDRGPSLFDAFVFDLPGFLFGGFISFFLANPKKAGLA